MRKALLTVSIVISILRADAQPAEPQKIGHADWEYIFSMLPEYKQIQAELKTYEGQLQSQLKLKGQDFENKVKQYRSIPPDTPEAIRKDKESELAYLQDNIQKFEQDAQASIQKKQTDLLAPVFKKIGSAIEEVAKANGYAYIINPQMMSGGDVIFYSDERFNISTLVLKKLGVNEPSTH